jgi:hypothetical protein
MNSSPCSPIARIILCFATLIAIGTAAHAVKFENIAPGDLVFKLANFDEGTLYQTQPVGASVGATNDPATGVPLLDAITSLQAGSAHVLAPYGNKLEDSWGIAIITQIFYASDPVNPIWDSVADQQQLTVIFYGAQDFFLNQVAVGGGLLNSQIVASVGLKIDMYLQDTSDPNFTSFSQLFGPGARPIDLVGAGKADDASYPTVTDSNGTSFTLGVPVLTTVATPGFLRGLGDLGGPATEFETTFNGDALNALGSGAAFVSVAPTLGGVGSRNADFDTDSFAAPHIAGNTADFSIQFTSTSDGSGDWLVSSQDPIRGRLGGNTKICVEKYYDANVNGQADPAEVFIDGWKVSISDGNAVIAYTPVCAEVRPTDPLTNSPLYTVSEFTPIEANWVATTAKTVSGIDIAVGETVKVQFGNVCIGAGGGKTPGFWSNRNGERAMNDGGSLAPELALLSALNLRNGAGANFDPATYASFRTWLLDSTAVNMAYKLSSHVAAMSLNVEAGFVGGGALVYAPQLIPFAPTGLNALGFISIGNLLTAANTELGLHGNTPSGDAFRAYQEALKGALDNANNNLNFVQPLPCPFTFAP